MLYKTKKKKKTKESTAEHCLRSTRRCFRLQPAPVAEAPIFMISKVHLRKLRLYPIIISKGNKNEQSRLVRGLLRLRPHVSGYFWIRDFFFVDTAIVHTYPVYPADESATFWIRSPEWTNPLWIWNRVDPKSGYYFLLTLHDRVKGLFRESPGNCSGACFSTFRGRRQILKSKPVE